MKFGKLIFRKISEIAATRYHILKLFGAFSPDPAVGAYIALPDLLAGFKRAYF